jgi:Zn-dependent protease with chaperone function
MKSGTGIFFDGITSARHAVAVDLASDMLVIRATEADIREHWRYDELEHLAAPGGLLRLGRVGNPRLARLEVRDGELAAAIDEASVPVDRSGAPERRARNRVVAWSFAAVVSLAAAAIFGVPLLADRLAPLVPIGLERWLGEAVNAQVRTMIEISGPGLPFDCNADGGEPKASAALAKLMRQLETAAALPIPLRVVVARKPEANAIALPGGYIYVYGGLIESAQNADELAAVIAHEIGHVARRDGMRSILQTAGLSFLFGMLLGDFVGGGAVVIAATTLLKSSYSRDVEAAADRYAVELMGRVGGDQRALGAILTRIAGANHPGMDILLDHPATKDRVVAIDAAAASSAGGSLLAPDEWAALRRICAKR